MAMNEGYQCPVTGRRDVNPQTVILTLEAPEIASAAQPGQFVHVACNQLLRRPLGIMNAEPERGVIQIGIRIAGAGTREIANTRPGETLSVLGPLGHGFRLNGARRVITVGGGTGIFPLYFVQRHCIQLGIDALAVCGYRSREDSLLMSEIQELGCQTVFAADAGDLDFAGNAAEALADQLKRLPAVEGTLVLTCGPEPMMRGVAAVCARYALPCQVSLEERMACGIGVCLVCACDVQGEDGELHRLRCCVEGPVFDADQVFAQNDGEGTV